MQYIIGLDDTDNAESRGTGHLARFMAEVLAQNFRVHGVTRHQVLEDERVPMTAKNSCAGIILEGAAHSLGEIALYARKVMLDDFQPGSDPGLCVAGEVPSEIIAYGRKVQREFITQTLPRALADTHSLHLEGLGGDEDGVIGALAAVGLAAHGSDGRYVMIGSIRELEGLQTVDAVLEAGISAIQTLSGQPVTEGLILSDKMRPARRNGQPVLFVEREDDHWLPLKLN
ncbi:MAG: ABC transporter substrate-binding protein [Chloroflexota bacterium]